MPLFDSHAHYFDRRFAEVEGGADAILTREVFGAGVSRVINVATGCANAAQCLEQAEKYEGMYAALGIHPEDCRHLEGTPEQEVAKLAELLGDAASRRARKIVALGEIGLDYHWEGYDPKRQWEFFDRQMSLANEQGLPVIIHDREAHGDCFDMICRYPTVFGVFHSYSGSAEMAEQLVRRGWYISFSGVVTFKNARKVREVAARVPHDRILVETDCPYLSPEPFRGRLNHSGRLCYTVQALANELGMEAERLTEVTYENACRLFGIH